MMKIYFCVLLLFFAVQAWGQELTDIERLLEGHSELYTEEEYNDIINTLLRLQYSPLDLNSANFDSLKMLFFLSDNQIDNVLAFRNKHGKFSNINELLLVPGIFPRDVDNIRLFIQTGSQVTLKVKKTIQWKPQSEWISRARLNLPLQEGYKNYPASDFKTASSYERKKLSRFRGGPVGVLVKSKMQWDKTIQFGFTLENDPGEAYFTRYQQTGFDFLSAHVSYTPRKFIQRLIIGDYRIQWGQGLTIWSGFSSGKSSMAIHNEKSGTLLSPYTSTDENRFLRGIAVSLEPFKKFSTELFFSYKKTDGDVFVSDSLVEEDWVTASLYESGYHRSLNECAKKRNLKELTTGGSMKWSTNLFKIGMNAVYYDFDPQIEIRDNIYNRYDDHGNNRFVGSIDYKTGFQSLYLYGETAISDKGAVATLNGLRFSGSSKIALNVLYRRYDKQYRSRYATGFAEYSNTSNEEGIYVGINVNLFQGLKVNAYYDRFRFFSPRYNAFTPGSGREALCEIIYETKQIEQVLRYKYETKPENLKNVIMQSVDRSIHDLRYQFSYRLNKQFETRVRANVVFYRKGEVKEKGYLVYNDLIYTAVKERFKMQFRIAYFNTDSYQSRIYAYENNVLYGYSFPAYYDEGIRTYLNMNVKAGKIFTFYLKSGFTIYPGREAISSSVTKVEGNKLYDLAFQIRARF